MLKVRKMINFDLDTNKYKEITNSKSASSAYDKVRNFMKNNNFLHRQGSCYVSKNELNELEVYSIVAKMSKKFPWLSECVRECDVTDITKNTPLIDVIKAASNDEVDNYKDFDIQKNQELDLNINMDIDMDIDIQK